MGFSGYFVRTERVRSKTTRLFARTFYKQLMCFDIPDLGKRLQPLGMLVMLDTISNRITSSRAEGRRTYMYGSAVPAYVQSQFSIQLVETLRRNMMPIVSV